MEQSQMSLTDLTAIARRHLAASIPNVMSTAVPESYLGELKNHLTLYPHDTKFNLKLEPNTGYGKVMCLENGCNLVEVALAPNPFLPDGGKRTGFGTLQAYRVHIVNHATHSKMRHLRVKAERAAANRATGKMHDVVAEIAKPAPARLSLLTQVDASFGSSGSSASAVPSRNTGSAKIKDENVPHTNVLKRAAEYPLVKMEAKAELLPSASGSSKKAKLEETKLPLGTIHVNGELTAPSAPTNAMSVAEARAKLFEVDGQLGGWRSDMARLARKRRLTKAERIRLQLGPQKVQELEQSKRQCAAAYDAAVAREEGLKLNAHASTSKLKVEANAFLPPPFEHPSIKARSAIVAPLPPVATNSVVKIPVAPPYKPTTSFSPPYEEDSSDEERETRAALERLKNLPIIAPLPDHQFDENGDFHGRGRDTFVGPQANPADIDNFLRIAGNAEQFDATASVQKALAKLGLTAQRQLLPGMTVALMPHQTIGVAWMLGKEKDKAFKGGCLSDEMGLGKTVQMIAVMVAHRSDDPKCKTNLILAPSALLDQWKLEIELKTDNLLKCHIYHGSGKLKKAKDVLGYDVIITTYQTMAHEWPDLEAEAKAQQKAQKKKKQNNFIATDSDEEDWQRPKRKKKREAGLLFQIDWYRVILDEAQNIRNRRTQNSRAVTDLNSTYRWCLTGTPIINGLSDAYPLFRFLQIRPWYDWTEFHGNVSKIERRNPTLAAARLQAIFATCNFRRMKNSTLEGKKLIELPSRDVELLKLGFTPDERAIYHMVETKSQETFNRFRRAGTVLKNYAQVLVLLLRLRQICCHASLIQEESIAYIEAEEAEGGETELARARRLISKEFVFKMKSKLKQAALKRMEAEQAPEAIAGDAEEDDECPICFDAFTDAVVTPCTHSFCRECLTNVLNTPRVEDVNDEIRYKDNESPCPVCRSAVSAHNIFARAAFEPTDADLAEAPDEGKEDKATRGDNVAVAIDDSDEELPDASAFVTKDVKGKGKAVSRPKRSTRARRARVVDSDDEASEEEQSEGEDDDDDMSDFIVQSDEDEEEKDYRRSLKKRLVKRRGSSPADEEDIDDDVICGKRKTVAYDPQTMKLLPKFLPSTKMKFMMESLRKWAQEHPDEKTLVISQWTQCLSLVSDYLSEQGVLHLKFQGSMNRRERDQAVRVFMSKDKASVMLMSLKCGGVGLNLTRANRVISLDLGWSPAIENQAFDRVHRLGQHRDVVVQRLVIKDTVEDRILALQERKQNLADGSLGEGTGQKIGRLSVRELAALFGLNRGL